MPVTTLSAASSVRAVRSWALSAPAWAGVAALALRLFLLVVRHFAQSRYHLDLQIIGQEAAFIAWSIASGKGFANPFPHYEAATAWLAPVFPALWSIGYKIFDSQTSSAAVYFGQIMNSVFSALTCWPVFWLGKRLFGEKIASVAAWSWALLPLAILFPLEWTWDQSLSALILAALLCATYKMRDAASDSAAWSGYGLLWGFAALVNPALCAVLPFLLVWLAFSRKQLAAPALRPLARSAALFLLAILPWTARNYFVLDGFVFIKSNFGVELWLGNNPDVPRNNVYANELNPMTNRVELLRLALAGEPGYTRARQRVAIAFIRQNPGTFCRLVLRRVLDTWTAWYDAHLDKWILALHLSRGWIAFCSIFSLLSAVGLVLALRADFAGVLPIAMCVLVFPVPYYITHSSLRYRHPIDPLLTIFAVFAVARVYARLRAGSGPTSRT